MTDLAWMKTYIGDEAARIGHLTAEEFGAYELLRRHYWQFGGLPNDDVRMMRIAHVEPERWETVRSAICDLFDDGWRLPVLDQERAEAGEKRAKAVERSQKAANARWNRDAQSNATSNAASSAYAMPEAMPVAMLEECPPAPAPDEVRYEERLAPTRTYAHARDGILPVPENDSMGRDVLRREGLTPPQVTRALPLLMAGKLDRSILDQIAVG